MKTSENFSPTSYLIILIVVLIIATLYGKSEASCVTEATIVAHDVRTQKTKSNQGNNRTCRSRESLRALPAAWGHVDFVCDAKFTVLRDERGFTYTEPYHIGNIGEKITVRIKECSEGEER